MTGTTPWATSWSFQSLGELCHSFSEAGKTLVFLVRQGCGKAGDQHPTALLGLVAEAGSWAKGRVWGGTGGAGRDTSALGTVTRTWSPCLSPQDFKNGIENMMFCLYRVTSSTHPYFQVLSVHRGLWRILQRCYLIISIFLHQAIPF